MQFVVVFLIITVILLLLYIVLMQLQIRSINNQLTKRLNENSRQPVSVELFNKDINSLTANINRYIKAEEILRINSIREDRKLRELIVNISHDLRTPLTAIKGYLQLLRRSNLTGDQIKKFEIAMKHTNDLDNLIQYFFEYSYLSNMEPELNSMRLNINKVVTECIVTFVPKLEENNLAVKFENTPPVYVLADEKMVKRIIYNLLGNCIKHSSGNIEMKVILDDWAIISIKNPIKSTANIDEQKLFDRFYTGDKSRGTSTGLGLAIVKILAEQLGGSTEAIVKNRLLEIRVRLPLDKTPS
ncbi:sensor histidine kinase [Pontibacillus salicampi]|uniref:histidine kinase n=1 Tax=Pontibacillus salicampi TaxID=1449801 RepID=A0ABV6LTY1_9BACI